jgi:proteic killer suppression protein
MAIVSFADAGTEDFFHGTASANARRIPTTIHSVATRKLDQLNAAASINDLRVPPGNRLEALAGNLAGYHSIRINDQWRIVFKWTPAGPAEVAITDYH